MSAETGKTFALKGDILYCKDRHEVVALHDGYVLVENGLVKTVQSDPPADKSVTIVDRSGKLIIPAFTDLHTHSGQVANKGIGYDKTLLDWLKETTFPEEKRFENLDYAIIQIKRFIRELWLNGLLHCVVMPTLHEQATQLLMEEFNRSGMYTFVGKVNMDQPMGILTENTEDSITSTLRLVEFCRSLNTDRVQYAICPRFALSCTAELMEQLGNLSQKEHLPVHTHLSENLNEIEAVKVMYPDSQNYADVYSKYGLLGQEGINVVVAHCVYSHQAQGEMDLLRNNNIWIAHCPTSNTNIRSGIAPVTTMYNDYQIGLGSDVSGGHTLNMFEVMRHAIEVSKLRAIDTEELSSLTATQAFFLATMGGGSFFGNVGSFLPGYKFNALVLNKCSTDAKLNILQDLERLIYLADHHYIEERYIDGKLLDRKFVE